MSHEATAEASGVLNEVTNTIHRAADGDEFETACGVTRHVGHDDLRHVSVERATSTGATRCGRCFSDAGGY